MKKILTKKFFEQNALVVAEELIGKYVVVLHERKEHSFIITETEAYDGIEDLASHASKGRTTRTELMFGEAGRFYIYLIYGMYYMLNIDTDKKEYPSAVLIRGIRGIQGEIDGPGKLTKKLGITKSINGMKAEKKTGVWFEDRGKRGEVIDKKSIQKTPRIGVDYAGPVWAKKDYRFILK